VVSVHKDAVLRRQGRASVYVIENGTAQSREVTLGPAVGSRFQVKEGLKPGDIVVIRGNERLRPGQPVSYPEQPDDNPNREQKS
jgi:multidrug efflux pump subunit AcrA (membrane-fusion protein)